MRGDARASARSRPQTACGPRSRPSRGFCRARVAVASRWSKPPVCTRFRANRETGNEEEIVMADPRMVFCVKLQREGLGLDRQPFKNELGKKLFENVSKDAWRMWLEHSKMLINEYRIDLMSKEGSEFLL